MDMPMISQRALYGVGAVGFGIIGIAFADFALQWQPVPIDIPMREALSYVSAVAIVLAGGAVLSIRMARFGALALFAIYGSWVLVLHAPRVLAHPADVATWLGFCEITALAAGGFALYASGVASDTQRHKLLAARIAFGACAILFGISHFKYAAFTATMVPSWIPFPLFWAYATGAGHTAAGLALISGIQARLAAAMLALMMGSFAVLVHIPRVFGAPAIHAEWTMLAVATSLTGAAMIIWRSCRVGFSPPTQIRRAAAAG